MKSLAEIIQSRRFHPTVQRRLEQAQEGTENGPDTPACKAEAEYREQVRAAVLKTMDSRKLDAFVYPTWSNPPRLIGDLNTPHGDNSQFFSPTTGFPSIKVPMGYTRGGTLPAGITFFGRAWDEGGLDRAGLFVRAGDEASDGSRHRQSVVGRRESGVAVGNPASSRQSESAVRVHPTSSSRPVRVGGLDDARLGLPTGTRRLRLSTATPDSRLPTDDCPSP